MKAFHDERVDVHGDRTTRTSPYHEIPKFKSEIQLRGECVMGNSKEMIAQLEAESAEFFKKVRNGTRGDREFARPDDEPLTEDEIAEIDQYWGKYRFAYPVIDYESFKTFKNRCGFFDVRHCPHNVRMNYLHPQLVNKKYWTPFRNKALMDYLYPDLPKPRTLARRMSDIYYDEDYKPITLEQLIEICLAHVKETGKMIVKPGGDHGGRGIVFLDRENASADLIKKILMKDMKNVAVVFQEVLRQSPFMDALNPTSVNTVRITTMLFKGRAIPLAAIVRVGKPGAGLDNWHSGGSLIGIDIHTGKLNNWAMAQDLTHAPVIASGIDLTAQELFVPNFETLKVNVCRAHYRLPYMKLISWDIALSYDNTPTFIECNFGGQLQLHEATTGPVFGQYLDELLDEYLLKKFYIRFATEDFVYREFHDHIEVESRTEAPKTLRDKPVTSR